MRLTARKFERSFKWSRSKGTYASTTNAISIFLAYRHVQENQSVRWIYAPGFIVILYIKNRSQIDTVYVM